MKTFRVLALLLLATHAALAKPGWLDDFDKGLAQAKSGKKFTLLDFTGSDWCVACKRLDKEVFAEQAFKDYAAANLVLIEVDFPLLTSLPEQKQDRNDAIGKKFKVEGYPTLVVLDPDGKELGRVEYLSGGPTTFIKQLEAITKKQPAK